MHSISVTICNIKAVIEISGHASFSETVKKRYREFTTRNRRNLVDLYLAFRLSGERLTPIINRPEVSASRNKYHFNGPYYTCTVYRKNGIWKGIATIPANIYVFDTVMRVLWSLLLPERNAFLVHSCGIANGKGAYLFPGRSGSGKTTLAKKAGRANILSDELVCVQVTPENCYLMGTPFWGEFRKGGRPIRRALQGIYFLKKSALTRTIKISGRLAFKKILKLILFFGVDAPKTNKLLELVSACLSQIHCYILNLNRDARIDNIMKLMANKNESVA